MAAIPEIDIFPDIDLIEADINAFGQVSHELLIQEAFNAIANELDTNGNTERFDQLRLVYTAKLLGYWKTKFLLLRDTADGRGRLDEGFESMVLFRQNGMNDETIVTINRSTPREHNHFQVAYDPRERLEQFQYPPTIESDIKTDLDESADLHFKVIFGYDSVFSIADDGNTLTIKTFERIRNLEDPDHIRHYMKDTRTITS